MQTQKRRIKFLEEKEVRQIIDKIGVRKKFRVLRDRAILETLFSTGLRVSEMCSLPDAPFESCKGETLELSITGKGGWQRTIYFSPTALKAIRDYLPYKKDAELTLFSIKKRGVELMIKKRSLAAGFEGVHPHTIRHSFACDLLRKGVNLFDVKEFLGHRSITSTQVYLHATNEQLKNIHSKLYK
jgi:site-specific recombinase XerD